MSKFRVEKTISIPTSFQRELADFAELLENESLDFYLTEIIETIINKAPRTDKFENNYTSASVVHIQYREEE